MRHHCTAIFSKPWERAYSTYPIGWRTDDEKSNLLLDLGYVVGHSGNIGPNGRFAYFVSEKLPGTILEVSETSGFKGEVFKQIADMCANWDGSDPIRR